MTELTPITTDNIKEVREAIRRNLYPEKAPPGILGPDLKMYATYAQLKKVYPGLPSTIEVYEKIFLSSKSSNKGAANPIGTMDMQRLIAVGKKLKKVTA